ncbi:MAG: hypothetical protein ABSH28_03540 [Acidobacteriota bacterium]|jgi:prolyl oligopeptidase
MCFVCNGPASAVLFAALAASVMAAGCSNNRETFPATGKKPVVEEHFGTKTVDNYRWLDNLDDPAVRKWNDAQNAHTRGYLDKIPFREQIYQRLKSIHDAENAQYYGITYKKKLFAMKSQPPKNQPFLVVLESAVDPKAGHGHGTGLSDRIEQEADVYAFLFAQLNVPYKTK